MAVTPFADLLFPVTCGSYLRHWIPGGKKPEPGKHRSARVGAPELHFDHIGMWRFAASQGNVAGNRRDYQLPDLPANMVEGIRMQDHHFKSIRCARQYLSGDLWPGHRSVSYKHCSCSSLQVAAIDRPAGGQLALSCSVTN